ncbi:MAG: hypothetical protein R3F44_08680 [Candidatus Competibacteraceae bacterium]
MQPAPAAGQPRPQGFGGGGGVEIKFQHGSDVHQLPQTGQQIGSHQTSLTAVLCRQIAGPPVQIGAGLGRRGGSPCASNAAMTPVNTSPMPLLAMPGLLRKAPPTCPPCWRSANRQSSLSRHAAEAQRQLLDGGEAVGFDLGRGHF